MIDQNIYQQFQSLKLASTEIDFHAIRLSETRQDFLAKNEQGAPIFLLHDASPAKYNPSINFRHLQAQFHLTCRVSINDENIEGQFCIVSCEDPTSDLYELFIRSVGSAIYQLPDTCSTRELESFVLNLKDLFQALSSPSNREISGLWSELFVITHSGNIVNAVSLWHQDKFDRFDFSSATLHIEIKSTIRGLRTHEFALEQLENPKDGQGYLISLQLQPLTGGIGILDLAKAIEDSLIEIPDLKQKLWANIAKSLGSDFSEKLDQSFDPTFAEKNLMIYLFDDLPKPSKPLDPRVTSLRFISNLSSVSSSLPNSACVGLLSIFKG